jgi:fructokinase
VSYARIFPHPGSPGPVSVAVVVKCERFFILSSRTDKVAFVKEHHSKQEQGFHNCFALSEATDGVAKNAHTVFGVILGTGCGGGIVVDGRLLDGPLRIAGEWGHNPLPWATPEEYPGPQCWCGRKGCLETWLSGPGMAADHARTTGETLTAVEIALRAKQGNGPARTTLFRHVDRLARGLAQVVNIIDPDVIVLGGGLSQLPHLYEQLPQLMSPHIFADSPSVAIKPPKWGHASGVRGAARLWDVPDRS